MIHNPDKVTWEQLENGWRFLDDQEVGMIKNARCVENDEHLQMWDTDLNGWAPGLFLGGNSGSRSYRSKLSVKELCNVRGIPYVEVTSERELWGPTFISMLKNTGTFSYLKRLEWMVLIKAV